MSDPIRIRVRVSRIVEVESQVARRVESAGVEPGTPDFTLSFLGLGLVHWSL